jgi:hypothetical protein
MKDTKNLVTDKPQMRRSIGNLGKFRTALYVILLAVFAASCAKEVVNDQTAANPLSTAVIAETLPANLADTVAVNPVVAVTFQSTVNPTDVSASTITLLEGTTPVQGTVSVSSNTATFTPAADLKPNTSYTATVKTTLKGGSLDKKGNDNEHSWSFKTGTHHRANALSVVSVLPLNSAVSVAVAVQPTVTFSEDLTATTFKTTKITLKQGSTTVAGSVTYSGKVATFKPDSSLITNKVYTGTVTFGVKEGDDEGNHESDDKSSDVSKSSGNYTWSFTTGVGVADVTAPTVSSAVPANNATAVAITSKPAVTFSEAMTATTITATTFTLKQGTTAVAGTVTYAGTTATFTPTASLTANLVYTGTITTGAKDVAGNAIAANYTWSFTTGVGAADVTAPTVSSAVPANNATAVAITSKPAVTFSEAMNATTITATTFTLKQGTTVVAGTVAYAGNTATFTPTASLTANLVYTGTVTTGAKDVAGNALAAAYTWSFTTAAGVVADVTPPTVLTIVPATGATSIALTSKVTATFSEAMTASTITSSTFTVSQGSTAVAGTVAYSGTTATFTPTSALVAGLVYTATITTGAKDAAGNAIAAAKTWSFTTAAAVVAVTSWATQVWPIIQSKCTPCHGTTGGSAGVNMGTYAQVAAMGNSSIDNSGMYSKMGVTAAEKVIIQAWITQGKLNN